MPCACLTVNSHRCIERDYIKDALRERAVFPEIPRWPCITLCGLDVGIVGTFCRLQKQNAIMPVDVARDASLTLTKVRFT